MATRHRAAWAWLLLLPLTLVLRFPGALPGPRVVSADDHLTVHPVFQTASGGGAVRHPHLSDPALQFKALQRRTVAALRRGEAPLWNPDLYGGAPLLADAQSAPLSAPTLARVAFVENTAQDVGVAWVLLWLGGGTAGLLLALGCGLPAAALGGVAAMLSPYPQVWLLHPHAATLAWLPWVLWGLERRSGVWVAVAVAGLLAGGHPGTAVHSLGVAAMWAIWRWPGLRVALGALVGVLLASPLWLPLAELAQRSTTAAARVAVPLEPRQLLDLVWPGVLGHPARGTWAGPGSWADGQLHPGLGTLAVALLGLSRKPGRVLWAGWALMVAASLLPLPGPVAHGRLGSEAAWLLAVAAGLGAHTVASRPLWQGALCAGVLATGLWARSADQGSLPAAAHDPAPAPWVADLRAAVCAPDCARVLGLDWAGQPNTLALAGLPDLRGYDLPVSVDTKRLMTALNPRPRGPWYPVEELPPVPLLRFLGVGAVLTTPERAAQPELERIPVVDAPLRAFRVPDPAPGAWLAPAPRRVDDPALALRQVAADPNAQRRPPVEGPSLPRGQGDAQPLAVTWTGSSRLGVTLAGNTPGIVVVQQAWAPGWRAAVDGVPRALRRVGGVWLGVPVTAADRRVDLRYRPDGWIWGVRLGVVGVLGLLALLARELRARRPPGGPRTD